WHALRDAARCSVVAHMDETGWKVEAQLRWLWAVVTEQVTFCEILPGRGFVQASAILGAEYAVWLIHDGWKIYYKFLKAAHHSCAAHLIRRCRDLAAAATPAAVFTADVISLCEKGNATPGCGPLTMLRAATLPSGSDFAEANAAVHASTSSA